MSIGSRRTREKEQIVTKEDPIKSIVTVEKKKDPEPKKEIPIKKVDPIKVKVQDLVDPKKVSVLINKDTVVDPKEEKPSIAVKDNAEAIKVIAEHIKETVELEKIEKIHVKQKKEREDTKEPNLIGIVGKTIVANDFRAICKKQGKQINVVLTELLHGWNMANYNL